MINQSLQWVTGGIPRTTQNTQGVRVGVVIRRSYLNKKFLESFGNHSTTYFEKKNLDSGNQAITFLRKKFNGKNLE